ncbi:hypothetical protein ACFSC4_15520 [Deinococcus malanensis]
MTHGLNADTPRFEVLGDAALVVHSRRAQALRASLLASPCRAYVRPCQP